MVHCKLAIYGKSTTLATIAIINLAAYAAVEDTLENYENISNTNYYIVHLRNIY